MQATYEWKLFFFFLSKICLLLAMGCQTDCKSQREYEGYMEAVPFV